MYFRRLKVFLALIGVVVAVWTARLGYLQLVRGEAYRQQAEESLIRPARFTATERGRITDRHDRPLAHDTSASGIAVDYRILAGDARHLARLAGTYRARPRMTPAELADAAAPMRARYERLLAEIAQTSGLPSGQLDQRRRQILQQVADIKEKVSRRMGRPTAIPEEFMAHTIIPDVSPDVVSRLIGLIGQTEGISLQSEQRRHYPWGECLAHVVGTEGPVSPEDIRDDPFAGDERRRYLPADRRGLTGLERTAEKELRGWRGLVRVDRDGREVEREPAVRGSPVKLTIDAHLQQQLYRVLARHVAGSPYPAGGAVVVINIGQRTDPSGHQLRDGEVLALVSFPSFDPNHWRETYQQLLSDGRGQPLLFRAVAGVYPPGSLVKPAVLAAALADGKLVSSETINCPGYLISPTYRAFHCWLRTPGHGTLSPVDALEHSCNVYFYKLGERMTLPGLTRWFDRFGIGHDLQTGLAEERPGILPTPLWLAAHRVGYAGYSPGDARNLAVGQGDLAVTPLAAANLMATIARGGVLCRPTLLRTGEPPGPASLGIDPAHMVLVRQGLDRVVNQQSGTAYRYARMATTRLAGKTGSAQASRRRIDGELFPPVRDAAGEIIRPSHAWFAGYAPADNPTVAIACLVEYGMSGGKVAGPLARDVVQVCINLDYVPATMDNRREVEGALDPVPLVGPEGRP